MRSPGYRLAVGALLAWATGCSSSAGNTTGEKSNGTGGQGGQAPDAGLDDATLARMMLAPPVAVGDGRTCVVLAGGAVRCWGSGLDGQLGLGRMHDIGDDETPASVGPVTLGGASSALSLGPDHACAVLSDGRLQCWGQNDWGQLGRGDTRAIGDDEAPVSGGPVALDGAAVDVVTGTHHTCTRLVDGRVRCWGANNVGQLGSSDVINPQGGITWNSPQPPVDLGGEVAEMAAGAEFTCARYTSGRVRCWGDNGSGQLGLGQGTTIPQGTPAQMADVPLGGAATAIVAYDQRVCALLTGGEVRCWGAGGRGSLGQSAEGNIGDDETPASLPPLDLGEPAVQISLGNQHGCAVLASGSVRCWGRNVQRGGMYVEPAQDFWGDDEPLSSVPVLALDERATQVSCGEFSICVLTESGRVRCVGWGASSGASGSGKPYGWESLAGGEVPLGGAATQVLTSHGRSCARRTDGAVLCWGDGRKLGYGDRYPDGLTIGDDEVLTSVPPVDVGGAAVAVATGGEQTCALLASGAARCWGTDISRVDPGIGLAVTLTIGDDESPASDIDVTLGAPVAQVVSVGGHRCALLAGGTVRCWDAVYGGALEDDLSTDTYLTVADLPPVALGAPAVQLVAGDSFSCALLDGGRVRCWGVDDACLGHPGVDQITSASALAAAGDVDLGGKAVQLAAGYDHVCALLDGGHVRCWGHGFGGILGHGTNDDIGDNETPAAAGDVDVGGPVRQLVAGDSHTCALLEGGRVRCWGYGILGYPQPADPAYKTPAENGDLDLGEPALFLAAGGGVTCAVLAGGRLRCWGDGSSGQFGRGTVDSIGDDEPPSTGDIDLGAPLLMP